VQVVVAAVPQEQPIKVAAAAAAVLLANHCQ
jgi:hypothetical protein